MKQPLRAAEAIRSAESTQLCFDRSFGGSDGAEPPRPTLEIASQWFETIPAWYRTIGATATLYSSLHRVKSKPSQPSAGSHARYPDSPGSHPSRMVGRRLATHRSAIVFVLALIAGSVLIFPSRRLSSDVLISASRVALAASHKSRRSDASTIITVQIAAGVVAAADRNGLVEQERPGAFIPANFEKTRVLGADLRVCPPMHRLQCERCSCDAGCRTFARKRSDLQRTGLPLICVRSWAIATWIGAGASGNRGAHHPDPR